MSKGEAAQAVEVSAYPDRYNNYEPVALTILSTLTGAGGPINPAPLQPAVILAEVTESSRVVFPLPEGTWVPTSPFGPRIHPITGTRRLHAGIDIATPCGQPIVAALDGDIISAGWGGGYGNRVVIDHGIQRVDACRAPGGQLLLVELEDLNPYLSLDRLTPDEQDGFVSALVASLTRLSVAGRARESS